MKEINPFTAEEADEPEEEPEISKPWWASLWPWNIGIFGDFVELHSRRQTGHGTFQQIPWDWVEAQAQRNPDVHTVADLRRRHRLIGALDSAAMSFFHERFKEERSR